MRGLAAVAATALVAVCAACTPTVRPVLALAARDGVPVALLQGCGDSPTELSVTVLGGAADAPPVQWTVTTDAPFRRVEEIPLLGTPPKGWRVTHQDPALRRIDPAMKYVVSSTGSNDFWLGGRSFYDIRAGEVLVSEARVAGNPVRRAEFQNRARNSC